MKRTIPIIFFALLATFSFGQKTAHINTVELINYMPEKAMIEKELTNLTYETDALLKELIEKYTLLAQEIQDLGDNWSPVILEMKKNELSRLEQTIQEAEYLAKTEFAVKEQELIQPLLDKAMEAIQKVADKKGYDYVIDTSSGSVLVRPDKDDILEDVLVELGLKAEK